MYTFSAPTLAALASGNAAIAQLIDMDLAIPWRVNTSLWDLVYLGETYLGAGRVGRIDRIDNTPSELKGIKFSIPAIDPADIAEALAADVQGKSVKIITAIYDKTTFAALDAFVEWEGRLDVMNLSEGALDDGRTFDAIEVTAEHIGIDLLRPCGLMFTNEDQQSLHPGYRSWEYVVDQSTRQIIFPTAEFFKR